jgi:hypothetical protein
MTEGDMGTPRTVCATGTCGRDWTDEIEAQLPHVVGVPGASRVVGAGEDTFTATCGCGASLHVEGTGNRRVLTGLILVPVGRDWKLNNRLLLHG